MKPLVTLSTRTKTILIVGCSLLSVIFYRANYEICSLVYPNADNDPEQLKAWWILKGCIYPVVFLFCFLIAKLERNKIQQIVCTFGAGIACSDAIDRIFFDAQKWDSKDWITIALCLIPCIYEFRRGSKT